MVWLWECALSGKVEMANTGQLGRNGEMFDVGMMAVVFSIAPMPMQTVVREHGLRAHLWCESLLVT
jgi:hypothetical protein